MYHLRKLLPLCLLLAALANLSACGKKGPLYLPPPAQPAPPAQAPTANPTPTPTSPQNK